jgi:hypothetical protein
MSDGRLKLILSFLFGVVFLAALFIVVLIVPSPTDTQFEVFRIIIALAAGGVAE